MAQAALDNPTRTGSANATASPKSLIRFLPYQRKFFDDTARVLVACWCRQAGKDFTTAAKAVDHALRTGQDWYIVSITQRQADATFAKCQRFARAFQEMLRIEGEARLSAEEFVEYDRTIQQEFRQVARTIHLPGGGSVTALPGRDPDTLAGLTGNVIFTEFGLFPGGGYDHWRVVFPLSTRGYQVVVISTPRGKNTKFFELVDDTETYSVHRLTIADAVADGLVLRDNNGDPCTIEAFRKLYGDETGWQREYLCEFTGDLEALVTWAKLQAAGREGLDFKHLLLVNDTGWDPQFFEDLADLVDLAGLGGRPEFGWDVARKGDLSVFWVNVRTPAGPAELRRMVLMKNCTFALQREVVRAGMNADRRGVGVGDATGLGMDSNETLHAEYGIRWEMFTFTTTGKAELGSLLKTAFDDGDQVLPPQTGDGAQKWIHTDLYAIQADRSGDRPKLIETPNPNLPDSHCDVAYSGALARKAAQIQFARPYVSTAA